MTLKDWNFKKYWADIKRLDLKQLFRDIKSDYHYNHEAYIDTLEYDAEHNRYILKRKTVKMREIKPSDLMVTGETYHYFNTELTPPPRIEKDKYGFLNTSAISNYQYMVNNDINDAMAGEWKGKGIDFKIVLIAGGVFAVALTWYFFFR